VPGSGLPALSGRHVRCLRGGASDLALPVPPGPAGWQPVRELRILATGSTPLQVGCENPQVTEQAERPRAGTLQLASPRSREPQSKGALLAWDRNQESGIPAGILLRNGPCQVRFRDSRFQELPRGVPWLGYLPGRAGLTPEGELGRVSLRVA
jgi:hypothetical protein